MGWEFWIDRGGTFTDVVARSPDGALAVHKLLSEDRKHAEPAIAGIRLLLEVQAVAPLPTEQIGVVRLGTTVATTNALLARKGEPTVLVITAGFADALVNRLPGQAENPRAPDRAAADAVLAGNRFVAGFPFSSRRVHARLPLPRA